MLIIGLLLVLPVLLLVSGRFGDPGQVVDHGLSMFLGFGGGSGVVQGCSVAADDLVVRVYSTETRTILAHVTASL